MALQNAVDARVRTMALKMFNYDNFLRYLNTPTINDVTLTADVQVAVPSGIHVYGEGFGSGGAAGTVAGTFTVTAGSHQDDPHQESEIGR